MTEFNHDQDAWERVQQSVAARATRDWTDDLDWYSLGQLTMHRDDAIALLERELREADDQRAATGLKVLEAQDSRPVLVEAMTSPSTSDFTRLAAADAVHELFDDEAAYEVVGDVLRGGQTAKARGQAAGWLGEYGSPNAEELLLAACGDPEPTVRQQSASSLLALTGLADRAASQSRAGLLSVRLSLQDPGAAAAALDDMHALLAARAAGEDLSAWLDSAPDTPAWTDMRTALTEGDATPEHWRALTPLERDRISYVLFLRLEMNDETAAEGLAALGISNSQ